MRSCDWQIRKLRFHGGGVIGLLGTIKTTASCLTVWGTDSCFPRSVKILGDPPSFEVRHPLPMALLNGTTSTSPAYTSVKSGFTLRRAPERCPTWVRLVGPRAVSLKAAPCWGPAGRWGPAVSAHAPPGRVSSGSRVNGGGQFPQEKS